MSCIRILALPKTEGRVRCWLHVLFFIIFISLLSACDNSPSRNTADQDAIAIPFPSSFARLKSLALTEENLEVKAVISGKTYDVTDLVIDDVNETISGKIEDVPSGNHEIELQYYVGGVRVAVSQAIDVSVTAGESNTAEVGTGTLILDDNDGDGYSNLSEIDSSTNHENRDDKPQGIQPNVKPRAPHNVVATPLNNSIKLSWDLDGSASEFIVYYSDTEIDATNLEANSTQTSTAQIENDQYVFTASELENDKTYYFLVVAANNVGQNPSTLISASPSPSETVPPPPSNVRTSPVGDNVLLTWEDVPNARDYTVYVSEEELTEDNYLTAQSMVFPNVEINQVLVTETLMTNTTYYIVVISNNSAGQSENIIINQFTSAIGRPGITQNIVLSPVAGGVQVNWDGKSETNYDIYWSDTEFDTENYSATSLIENAENGRVISGLDATSTYWVLVVAKNDIGVTPAAQVSMSQVLPIEIEGLTVVGRTGALEVTWNPIDNFTYTLYVSSNPISEESLATDNALETFDNVSSPHTVSGLTSGQGYYVAIIANNSTGSGPLTINANIVSPIALPSIPEGLALTALDSAIRVSWAAQPDLTYTIYYSTSPVTTENIGSVNSMTAQSSPVTVAGLTRGQTYHVAISATNDAGEGEISANRSIEVPALEIPSAPQNFAANAIVQNINLSWNTQENTTHYTIYMSQDATLSTTNFASIAGVTVIDNLVGTSWTSALNLMAGTTYYFVITASNASGTSNASGPINETPLPEPQNYVDLSYQEAIDLYNSSPDSTFYDLVANFEERVETPPVKVLMQELVVDSLSAELTLSVSLPPYTGELSALPLEDVPDDITSAYYNVVDPDGLRNNISNWLFVNNFSSSPSSDAVINQDSRLVYRNRNEYNNVREMIVKKNGNNYAFASRHYNNFSETDYSAITAIEYTPRPDGTGDNYVKFYAFDSAGNRVNALDLDGTGAKPIPFVCMSCHGGDPTVLIDNTTTPTVIDIKNVADVDAKLIPFDLDAIDLDPTDSQSSQHDTLRNLNRAVVEGLPSAQKLIGGILPIQDRSCLGFAETETVSYLSISNAGDSITDVNLTINDINHTFIGDLEINLESPNGSVVQLFRGNGGSVNNIRDLILDDEATESINNLTSSSSPAGGSYIPLNPLSQFDSENPNGIWKLKVKDRACADSGQINQWSIQITTASEVQTMFAGIVPIEDAISCDDTGIVKGPVAVSTIYIENPLGTIEDVDIRLEDISHTWVSDLEISIESPNGKSVLLMEDIGIADSGGTENIENLRFNDAALSVIPAQSNFFSSPVTGHYKPISSTLSEFNGDPAQGAWKLKIIDDNCADVGRINNWSLVITTSNTQSAGETLVNGWYNNDLTNGTFDGSHIPSGWQNRDVGVGITSDELYSQVIAKSCRSCHIQQAGNSLNIGMLNFDEFLHMIPRIERKVYQEGSMPNGKIGFDNFWTSVNPEQHSVLRNFMPTYNEGLAGPGSVPLAEIAVINLGGVGNQNQLSASESLFASNYFWEITDGPEASALISTAGNNREFSFIADVAGTYTVRLSVSNDDGVFSNSVGINLILSAPLSGVSTSEISTSVNYPNSVMEKVTK